MNYANVVHVQANKIYQIPGYIYDEERPEFDCFMPEYTGDFWIVDCLICDKNGNLHPDYQKGVPVHTELMKLS
jgi:hypothetical protein